MVTHKTSFSQILAILPTIMLMGLVPSCHSPSGYDEESSTTELKALYDSTFAVTLARDAETNAYFFKICDMRNVEPSKPIKPLTKRVKVPEPTNFRVLTSDEEKARCTHLFQDADGQRVLFSLEKISSLDPRFDLQSLSSEEQEAYYEELEIIKQRFQRQVNAQVQTIHEEKQLLDHVSPFHTISAAGIVMILTSLRKRMSKRFRPSPSNRLMGLVDLVVILGVAGGVEMYKFVLHDEERLESSVFRRVEARKTERDESIEALMDRYSEYSLVLGYYHQLLDNNVLRDVSSIERFSHHLAHYLNLSLSSHLEDEADEAKDPKLAEEIAEEIAEKLAEKITEVCLPTFSEYDRLPLAQDASPYSVWVQCSAVMAQ